MTVLKIAAAAGALLLVTPSLLPAQTNPIGRANDRLGAIGPTEPSKSSSSKESAGSTLTASQVKKRLEKRGFEQVRQITAQKDGGFTARAMRDGRTMTVAVDKFGKIAAK